MVAFHNDDASEEVERKKWAGGHKEYVITYYHHIFPSKDGCS